MFRLTVSTVDDDFITPIQPALERAGLQVVRYFPAEGNEPDPAAAPDVLLLDWRHAVPAARPAEVLAWPEAMRLAALRPPPRCWSTQELDVRPGPVHEPS